VFPDLRLAVNTLRENIGKPRTLDPLANEGSNVLVNSSSTAEMRADTKTRVSTGEEHMLQGFPGIVQRRCDHSAHRKEEDSSRCNNWIVVGFQSGGNRNAQRTADNLLADLRAGRTFQRQRGGNAGSTRPWEAAARRSRDSGRASHPEANAGPARASAWRGGARIEQNCIARNHFRRVVGCFSIQHAHRPWPVAKGSLRLRASTIHSGAWIY